MDLSVVVPVYNGENTITGLFQRTRQILEGRFSWEMIFVYDCGRDDSWTIINNLCNLNSELVKGFRLDRNYGQHNATLFGIKKASGDFIITIDEDLQHDPKFIPDLIGEQRRGDYDVVYGKFIELQHSGIRIWTSELLREILKIMVPYIYYDYSSYRLLKRSIAEKITAMNNSYSFIDGYIGSATENISSFPVEHYRRTRGQSSYYFIKLFKHAMFIILSYSKIKTWLLLASFFFNLSAVVINLINHEANNNGINRLISGLFIIGITLLSVGLITELIHYRYLKLNSKISEVK